MKNLLTKSQKHYLWQDELGDDFVLLKYGEVYQVTEDNVRIVTWSHAKANQLIKLGIVVREDSTDDGLWLCDVNKKHLDLVISLGKLTRRASKNSKWLQDKEKRLAHRILKYNSKPNKDD